MVGKEATRRYRQRAEVVRAMAGSAKDTTSRKLLERIAKDYERMARTLDRIAETERALAARKLK